MLGTERLSIDEIKALADIVSERGLGSITVKNGDTEVTIYGGRGGNQPLQNSCTTAVIPSVQTAADKSAEKPDEEKSSDGDAPAEEMSGTIVKAPIVGTYYSSPAPNKPAFVEVGSRVKKGDTLMIIESMKLMNEIQSELDGTVVRLLAENGAAVEYDQPIMIIK